MDATGRIKCGSHMHYEWQAKKSEGKKYTDHFKTLSFTHYTALCKQTRTHRDALRVHPSQ